MAEHRRRKPWWGEVNATTREPFPSRSEAMEAEDRAIIEEKPRYNIRRPTRVHLHRPPVVWPLPAETVGTVPGPRSSRPSVAPTPVKATTAAAERPDGRAILPAWDVLGKRLEFWVDGEWVPAGLIWADLE